MRIGFDISQTGEGKAGCGYFAASLIRELAKLDSDQEYVLYPTFGDFFFDPHIAGCAINNRRVSCFPKHQNFELAKQFWTAPELEQHLGEIDIIHSNNYWCPRQLKNARLVYTLYDLSFLEEPGWTTEANRVGCFYGVFGAAVEADWIISISHSSRHHFLNTFPHFPAERVRVIFPGCRLLAGAEGRRPAPLADIRPYHFWLSVGTIEPRKNLDRLMQAFARYVAADRTPMPLVLAGRPGWLMEEFVERIQKSGLQDLILLLGYVSDQELVWLYKNCYAHIYVSLFEGFGLPVLEGMTLGAPTIASRSTSIPEITGTAAILIDPLDVNGLASALTTLSSDQRHKLTIEGRKQAQKFQWKDSAVQLCSLYELAAKTPKRISGAQHQQG